MFRLFVLWMMMMMSVRTLAIVFSLSFGSLSPASQQIKIAELWFYFKPNPAGAILKSTGWTD